MARRKVYRGRRHPRRRPLARVRRTWLTSMVPTVCAPIEIPLGPCADPLVPGQGRLILVGKEAVEEQFSDACSVKRIVGDLWFLPTYDGAQGGCLEAFEAGASLFVQLFTGLRKLQTNDAGDSLAVTPLVSDFDFSESEWLKTWQHVWTPPTEIFFQPPHNVVNCSTYVCPDVHTAGLTDNDFVDGTGTINIETDCGDPQSANCTAEQEALCSVNVRLPAVWHLHLDVKKSIRLREFEQLVLDIDVIYSDAQTLNNPRLQVIGGIKCLLQF